ncbi:MAG TPA: peptidoglycan bridge formation glycyltransferase FemA/FemB family protein [Candidatus Dojkabacteria bacterium]|nr:peptidoglycan bridge formation glycyltransferase FemA/FemB family protein [Candidatus Dojkabacteria bacterium]
MAITLKEINSSSEWEGFISQNNYPTSFFQSWLWGNFEQEIGKKVFRLGIFHDEVLFGVGLATLVVARRGKFLHFRNGPVMSWQDEDLVKEIFLRIKDFADDLHLDFVRISPLVPSSGQEEKLLKKLHFVNCQMHDVDAEVTWVLDLDQSAEQILAGMRKHTRYSIHKAEKDGIKVIKTQDPKAIDEFWRIFKETIERQKWHAYTREYLAKEFAIFASHNSANLFLAQYQGKNIAGSIFIYYNGVVYYHHSGSLTEYRNIPGAYLIQWESIKEAKRMGMKKYNFFGIARTDDPKHPWHGLSFFKKGFGGREERFMHAKDLPLKNRYWLTYFFEKLERKRRGY